MLICRSGVCNKVVLGAEAKQGAAGAVGRGVVEVVKSVGVGTKAAPKDRKRLHYAQGHVHSAFGDSCVQRRQCLVQESMDKSMMSETRISEVESLDFERFVARSLLLPCWQGRCDALRVVCPKFSGAQADIELSTRVLCFSADGLNKLQPN